MEKKFDVYYVLDTGGLNKRYLDANGVSHDKPKAMTYETARRVLGHWIDDTGEQFHLNDRKGV